MCFAKPSTFCSSTGVQRIVTGVLSVTGKNDEATFTIKYQALPVNYDTTIHVLDTDYDSYAVLWSCSSVVGPVGHTGKLLIVIDLCKTIQTQFGILFVGFQNQLGS